MKAWAIFSHSVLLVWRNRWDALRISGALYAIYAVVQVTLLGGQDAMMDMDSDMIEMDPGEMGSIFFAALLQIVITLWIAVAWHRFVLLEEYPTGWLPAFHGASMLGYFWRSIVLGFGVAFAVGLPAAIVAVAVPVLAGVGVLFGLFFGIVLGFRLAPALPAAAVGDTFGFRQAWEATSQANGTAIALALLGVFAALLVQVPVLLVSSLSTGLGTIMFIVINWFVTLVSASVLTTIYGHYVQGRPIA
ncbi:hypothetical protein [Roseivivax sp. CAU 1753]